MSTPESAPTGTVKNNRLAMVCSIAALIIAVAVFGHVFITPMLAANASTTSSTNGADVVTLNSAAYVKSTINDGTVDTPYMDATTVSQPGRFMQINNLPVVGTSGPTECFVEYGGSLQIESLLPKGYDLYADGFVFHDDGLLQKPTKDTFVTVHYIAPKDPTPSPLKDTANCKGTIDLLGTYANFTAATN